MHFLEQREDDERRNQSEADIVGQRIQVFPDDGVSIERTCGHTVEEVEHGTDDDEEKCHSVLCFESHHTGYAAREQVHAGQRVGDMAGNAVCHDVTGFI